MNSKDIRRYWLNKYEDTTGKPYETQNFILDLTLFKRLIIKYNEYVVLEAIDRFLESNKTKYKTIQYFSSKNFFEDRYYDIINEKDITKFKRLYKNNKKIQELVEEYQNYIGTISLSDKEKERKIEILETLKGMEKEINESTRT